MFFIDWRGYGLLGILPPILGLILFGFMAENFTASGAGLGAGLMIGCSGLILAVVGWKLNRFGNRHALYSLPLWFWGALYALGGLGLAGWIGFLVSQSGWKN